MEHLNQVKQLVKITANKHLHHNEHVIVQNTVRDIMIYRADPLDAQAQTNPMIRLIFDFLQQLQSEQGGNGSYIQQQIKKPLEIINQYPEEHNQYPALPYNKKQMAQQVEVELLRQDIDGGKNSTDTEKVKLSEEATQYLKDNGDKEHLQELYHEIFGMYFVANQQANTHQATPQEANKESEERHKRSVAIQKQIIEQADANIEKIKNTGKHS